MTPFVDMLNGWSDRWATLTVAAVWQSSLLVLVVAGVSYALRRSSPTARYWLWQVVAIKLLVLPLWSWSFEVPWSAAWPAMPRQVALESVEPADRSPGPTRYFAPHPTAAPASDAPRAPATTLPASALSWTGWLFLGWSGIVCLQAVGLAVQRWRLSRLLNRTVAASAELVGLVADVGRGLGLRRLPEVRMTDVDCSPFVCGAVRGALVLPQSLARTLEAVELRQVLAHELAHIKRRDLAWGWIPEIARVLYFFHPVAHWVHFRIRLERELACDQLALEHVGRGPAEYAETLVRVVGMASRPSVLRTSVAAGLAGQPRADS